VIYAILWYVTLLDLADDLKTQSDFGLKARPPLEARSDMVRWMAGTGRMDKKLAGKFAA